MREREVLALVGRGCTNGEIGTALFISPKMASVHVSNIMRKLGVRRRVEAAAVAHRLGLDAEPAQHGQRDPAPATGSGV
jgi:DNA-binding CsgD family transcriptional regulator